ncbi:MAG TPA: hypothetical protein VGT02_11255 [Methylomirabilota bacterium]|nr:hypothetical protein [Methylomirabilota bacterium]
MTRLVLAAAVLLTACTSGGPYPTPTPESRCVSDGGVWRAAIPLCERAGGAGGGGGGSM